MKARMLVFFVALGLGLALGYSLQWQRLGPSLMPADTVLPDAGRYRGETDLGRFHGEGMIVWPNGRRYEGEFVDGLMEGEGRYESATGEVYIGHFDDGMRDGDGRLETPQGETYVGRFRRGRIVEGIYRDGEGNEYEGTFQAWAFDGMGTYRSASGDVYRGEFEQGELTGDGVHVAPDGTRYEGEFTAWRYDGQGELTRPNGERYVGTFRDGYRHGRGRLIDADAGEVTRKGLWQWGRYQGGDGEGGDQRFSASALEEAIYRQPELIASALEGLAEQRPGRIDLYFVGFAPYGGQDVFRNEIEFAAERMVEEGAVAERMVLLGNHPDTLDERPLATTIALQRVLSRLTQIMDPEEDVLFLYVTSHGSKDHRIAVQQPGLELPDLGKAKLANVLDEAGFHWRVVGLSACYAGGFIEPLAGPRTLVMTAARADRPAYGCGDQSEMTYFGKAYFRDALPEAASFAAAFASARERIREWENEADHEPHAQPQIHAGEAIVDRLQKWREQ